MSSSYINKKWERFRLWWQLPVTAKDRSLGIFVGLFAGFWFGLLGGALSNGYLGTEVSILYSILVGVLAGVIVGASFPKWVSVLLFPFATFGGSA